MDVNTVVAGSDYGGHWSAVVRPFITNLRLSTALSLYAIGLDIPKITAETKVNLPLKVPDGVYAIVHDANANTLPNPIVVKSKKGIDVFCNDVIPTILGIVLRRSLWLHC